MIQYSIVTEPPDSEPVTLQEAKDHLEYTGTAKNNLIQSLIKSARRICEKYAGLSLVTQEREIKLDRFPCKLYIDVPYGPIQSITSFTYLNDTGGTTTLVEDTDFKLDAHSRIARVYPIDEDGVIDTWPTNVRDTIHPVSIIYQAGYDDVSGEQTPEEAKIVIKQLVAKMFEHRGDDGTGKGGILDWDMQTILDNIKVTWNANVD